MADNWSANFPLLVSREQAGNKIGAALRLYVGRRRRYSVKQLANATGVKDRIIECAMTDAGSVDYRPLPPECLLSLIAFLGPDFTNEFLCLAGQGAFELPDEEPDPGEVAADNTDDNAVVVRAAIDGHFDQDERRDLKVVGSRMMTRGSQLVALGKRRKAA
jgi:hypothetical protein